MTQGSSPDKEIAAWELQLFVIHKDALFQKFALPEGWEPVYYEDIGGNQWHVMARRQVTK